MSDAILERRCRRLARAYPDRGRADEVLTTLLECNAGRRGPRPGDVVNVLWHGLVTRLRRTGRDVRSAPWREAAAAAVAQLVVMQAAAALAMAAWAWEKPLTEYERYRGYWQEPQYAPIFFSRAEQRVALAFAALSLLAAGALALRRARATAVLSVAAAVTGLAGVLATWGDEKALTLQTSALAPLVTFAAFVAAGVLGTRAVPRAARAVPAWWWGMSGMACVATALWAVYWGWGPFDHTRPGVMVVALSAQAALLLLLALPLARSFPLVFGGVAVVALAGMPVLATVGQRWITASATPRVVALASAAGWLVVGGVLVAAMWGARRGATPEA